MYITTTVERDGEEIEIEVELSYRRGSPPSYWDPGDPDEIEIENIFTDDSCNLKIELTPDEEDKIIKLAFEKASTYGMHEDEDAPDDTYDKY